jgi:hypothetical protein
VSYFVDVLVSRPFVGHRLACLIEILVQVYCSRYSLNHMFLVYLIRLHAACSIEPMSCMLARLPNRLADCHSLFSHPNLLSNLVIVVISIKSCTVWRNPCSQECRRWPCLTILSPTILLIAGARGLGEIDVVMHCNTSAKREQFIHSFTVICLEFRLTEAWTLPIQKSDFNEQESQHLPIYISILRSNT